MTVGLERSIYRDADHLTKQGAQLLVPLYESILNLDSVNKVP